MEGIQRSPSQSSPQQVTFSLESICVSPQKSKYVPPRVKVVQTADLSIYDNTKWFMDTYNFEGVYQDDLHLFVKMEGQKYGDMGCITNAKEDVNDVATPCISFTTVLNGETTKAKNISLLLKSWAPFDMTGSKEGKEKSLVKLGMNIANFANVEDSGIQNYAQFVKGVQTAKEMLGIGKKAPRKKNSNIAKQDRALIQSKGRDLVKSAIASIAGKVATSSQGASTIKVPMAQVEETKESQGEQEGKKQKQRASSSSKKPPRSGQTSREKRSISLKVTDNEDVQKRQKLDLPPTSSELVVFNPSSLPAVVVADENKALAMLETKRSYYPFGFDSIFSIDVLNCFPAPAHYVYRRLNSDWVKILTRDLVKDTKFEEILAIVMPCDEQLKFPLQTFAVDQVSTAKYWIISGQHSISAAKCLQKLNLTTAQNNSLKEQFRYRRSKIILDCPPKISREISKDANISVAKSMQEEPFLDQLLQARSQWIANGRPSKPLPGVNTSKKPSKAWEDFVETTEYTLHKGFVKNDLHLLLCDDTIWNNWVLIMDKYARGGLPNTKGDILSPTAADQRNRLPTFKRGKIQQASGTVTLGPTIFRCIAGLEVAEVLALQESILNKAIILKKGKHTKDLVDMEEFAWSLKVDRVLKAAIIDFFNDLTKEMLSWDQTCEKYKLGEHEYNQLKSYTEAFVKDSLNRTKKTPSLPITAITLLHHLYRASMGQGLTGNSIPWTIKEVGLDMQKFGEFCKQIHVPFQLAIMDARGFCNTDLSADTFSSITSSLNAMNSRLEYIFVCFLDFINIGCLVEGVSAQSGKVQYEVGTITRDNEHSLTTGVFAYASVVLFVSKGISFESIDKRVGEKIFMSTSASARGNTIDKDFLMRLIDGFSPEQNYVLDLFSGGDVLEQSLLLKRRCIALCKDDLEAMSLETKCSQILEENPLLQEWCGQTSSQNRVIDLNDEQLDALNNMEVDDQPSGDDEDEDKDSKREESSSRSDNNEEVSTEKPESSVADKEHGEENQNKNDDTYKEKGNNEEDTSHLPQTNEQKEGSQDKDTNNVDGNSQIGRLEN